MRFSILRSSSVMVGRSGLPALPPGASSASLDGCRPVSYLFSFFSLGFTAEAFFPDPPNSFDADFSLPFGGLGPAGFDGTGAVPPLFGDTVGVLPELLPAAGADAFSGLLLLDRRGLLTEEFVPPGTIEAGRIMEMKLLRLFGRAGDSARSGSVLPAAPPWPGSSIEMKLLLLFGRAGEPTSCAGNAFSYSAFPAPAPGVGLPASSSGCWVVACSAPAFLASTFLAIFAVSGAPVCIAWS